MAAIETSSLLDVVVESYNAGRQARTSRMMMLCELDSGVNSERVLRFHEFFLSNQDKEVIEWAVLCGPTCAYHLRQGHTLWRQIVLQ